MGRDDGRDVTSEGTQRGDARPGQARGRRRHAGAKVIAALMVVGAAAGVLAYRNLVVSEKVLTSDLSAVRKAGASLDVQGCIDEVLDWHAHCDAMKSLCDQSVPRFMEACLVAGDRADYCADIGDRSADTSFGFTECKTRVADRDEKKACAVIYRVIDGHCQGIRRGT